MRFLHSIQTQTSAVLRRTKRHHHVAAGGLGVMIAVALLTVFGVQGDAVKESVATASVTNVTPALVDRSNETQPAAELPATPTTPEENKTSVTPAHSALAVSFSNEKCRELLLGEWELELSGHRQLTVRSDQTATMVVKPNALGQFLFGPKLTFEFHWTVENGHVTFEMTGGAPAEKVKIASNMWTIDSTQPIVELAEDRAVLLDLDGTTRYEWRRAIPVVE